MRPNPQKKQVIKNGRLKNNPRHKKPKVHGITYKTNLQITANALVADKEGEAHARPRHHQPVPSQYRKWCVMSQRAWSGSGEREKTYSGVFARLFWGKYPVGMTCHPKEVRMS